MSELTKLPPLPKRRTRADDRKERLATNLKAPPPILGEWGGLGVGRWAETKAGDATEVVGRCARCGTITAAIGLKLTRKPFGRGEEYRCTTCINEPRESES